MLQPDYWDNKERDYITPVLAALHWLPASYRIQNKVAPFAFKALSHHAPAYLVGDAVSIRSYKIIQVCYTIILAHLKLISKGSRAFAKTLE